MARKVKDDGRTTRWDAHREERRADLVEAAVRAIDRHGPDASIADIAAEAGVSKPVLYRYFADKNELHAAIGQWGAAQVLEALVPALLTEAPIRARVGTAVDAYLATIEEHPRVFLLLVRHHAADSDPLATGRAVITATFTRLIGDAMRGLGVDAGGAEPWAHSIVGLGVTTGEWWLSQQTMSRAAVSGYLTAFVWHAFEGIAEEYGVPLSKLDTRPTKATPISRARKNQ